MKFLKEKSSLLVCIYLIPTKSLSPANRPASVSYFILCCTAISLTENIIMFVCFDVWGAKYEFVTFLLLLSWNLKQSLFDKWDDKRATVPSSAHIHTDARFAFQQCAAWWVYSFQRISKFVRYFIQEKAIHTSSTIILTEISDAFMFKEKRFTQFSSWKEVILTHVNQS